MNLWRRYEHLSCAEMYEGCYQIKRGNYFSVFKSSDVIWNMSFSPCKSDAWESGDVGEWEGGYTDFSLER